MKSHLMILGYLWASTKTLIDYRAKSTSTKRMRRRIRGKKLERTYKLTLTCLNKMLQTLTRENKNLNSSDG